MNIKRFIGSLLFLFFAVASFHAAGEAVSANLARQTANSFIKSHSKASPGSLMAPAMADIELAYAEPSNKDPKTNCYYIFNIKGGGFIIVSGDNRATPVLGFSDKGQIDIFNLPDPLQFLLDVYKADIDYLLTHDIKIPMSFNQSENAGSIIVAPMTKSTWGQQEPYYNMCPMLNGKYSKVGCSGTCLAQTLYFWQFPVTCDSLPTYYSARLSGNVPALPPTVFEYDKMLPTYADWNYSKQALDQGVYTEEQAEAVAKLCRYCGQILKMNYSPASSANKVNKIDALKQLGYNSKMKTVYRDNYDDSVWVKMLQAELDAGRAIEYSGKDPSRGSAHAFIIDGYDSEDYFHLNLGWYGFSDGWYQISAMILTYLNGTSRHYKAINTFIQGLEPPLFCTINAEITAQNGLLMLGGELSPQANDVKLSMSYRTLPFMFTLTDANGNQVAVSESITLNRLTFENHSDISLALTLPEVLPQGEYNLSLNYRTAYNQPLTQAVTAEEKLYVLGKFAKFGTPFGINDVISAIDMVVFETGEADITDVTMLIDYLLEN